MSRNNHRHGLVKSEESQPVPQLANVLEVIGQAVCLVDGAGRFCWSNRQFAELNEEIKSRVSGACREFLECRHPTLGVQSQRFCFSTSGERYFEVTAVPLPAPEDRIGRLVVTVVEVSDARRLQRKINALDQAGRELVRLDAQQLTKLDVSERLALLEDRIVRFSRELMHFNNFAIWVLDHDSQKLEVLVNNDLPPEAVEVELYASREGNGIAGYVAATGRSYICPDVGRDPRYLPGIPGARSSLTVPLWLHDRIKGVFDVESTQLAAFTEDDRQFAEIFGRHIAIALNTLDLLVTEQVTTTGKLASNVESEIAGPLNDILTDASALMEDYIGHDDLRKRLQAITDHVVKVKKSVRQVAEPSVGLLGLGRCSRQRHPMLYGRRVLVADDEQAIRETIREILASFGCDVETARDGVEALCLLAERSYDVVLSDIRMPRKDGYEVFAAVKEHTPDCPVILMTGFGYDPNHSIIRARREGLSGVLFKPFKVDQLVSELTRALAAVAVA